MNANTFLNCHNVDKLINLNLRPKDIRKFFDQVFNFIPDLGFPVQLYSDHAIDKFLSIPDGQKYIVLNNLFFRLRILSEFETLNSKDEESIVKNAMRQMDVTCDNEFLNSILENDIVEIYSFENIQTFANFEFFRYSSYSLLDVSVNKWDDLFSRQDIVTLELQQKIFKTMTEGTNLVPYRTRPHLVQETQSVQRKKFIIYMGNLAPVYNVAQTSRYGIIHTLRVRPLVEGETPNLSSNH